MIIKKNNYNIDNIRNSNNLNNNISVSNNNGQIVVFLSIIFIGVLFFSGILVDGARIISGKMNVTRAVEDACVSSLALYNSQLKNDYGIFALSVNNREELKETVEAYLNKNLNTAERKEKQEYLIDLYDFKIEKLSVTPIFNLTNNSIVKEQILEHMKYRAPKELGENILKKFNMIKDVGEIALLYEKKTEIEKELDEVDSIQRKLKRNISGTLGDGAFEADYIEKFNLDGVRDNLIDTYTELIADLSDSILDIKLQGEYLRQLKEALSGIKFGEDELNNSNKKVDSEVDYDESGSLQMTLQKAKKEYLHSLDQLLNIKTNIASVFQKLSNTYTNNLIHVNENTITNIEKLMESCKKLSSNISELSKDANLRLNERKNENELQNKEDSITGEFKHVFLEDLNNLKNLIPDYEKGNNMINTLKSNILVLNSSLEALNYVQYKVESEDVADINIYGIKETLSKVNEQYKTIEFNYLLPVKIENIEDPRKDMGAKVKEVLVNLVAKGLNIQLKDIDFNELPSRQKVDETNFDDADAERPQQSLNDPGYYGNLDSIGDDIDLTNPKGSFPNKALNFISNIGKAIGNNMLDMRDDIYISQYIIDNFSSRVDKTATGSNEVYEVRKERNEREEKEEKHNVSFQAEVEYILHGSELEQVNVTKAMGQVTLIRFGINTLQIYMDAAKKKEAYSLATAIAGWWTGGAGIPIIANLILCSWGMIEGINDLKLLIQGESVPIFKKSNTKFSYHDYLLLFLMQKDSNTKIDRIQDLIELNIRKSRDSFKMGNTCSAIRVEAEISMRYLFVTQSFMPTRLKTPDGRHKINVLLYEGY